MYKKSAKTLAGHGIGNLYLIKSINNFIISHLKSNLTYVQGHKMYLDSSYSLEFSIDGIWEPLETDLVKKEIKKGDIVLDIGANIGYYTLIFAKLVGKEGKVYAFEPDPNTFALLKKNIEMNRYGNVVLEQKAVSNKTGKIKLYLSSYSVDNRTYDSGDGRKYIEVESMRLDDYFKNDDEKISVVKMDIQGAEGIAIEGMPMLLEKNEKLKIITEFWPLGLQRCGTEPRNFSKLLEKYGFKLYNINEQEKKIKLITTDALSKTYTPEKDNYTNLLCVRDNSATVE